MLPSSMHLMNSGRESSVEIMKGIIVCYINIIIEVNLTLDWNVNYIYMTVICSTYVHVVNNSCF